MQVYRTPLLTLDPDAKAGGGLVEVVKLADAQAMAESLQGQLVADQKVKADYDRWLSGGVYFTTADYEKYVAEHRQQVEALQAQLKQLDRTLADVYAQRDRLQRELVASKAENSRLMGVAEQQRELRESGEVYLDDVKAQLRQVQRERDELQVQLRLSRFNQANAEAAQNGLQAKIRALTQQLDAEREKVKAEQEQWEIQAREGGRLKDQLSQLQALVRLLLNELDDATYVDSRGRRYATYKEDVELGNLDTAINQVRATVDAATPAPRQKQGHSCEIPGCVSCANPEGGDDE